jgi:hypothetical protein
MRVVRDHMAYKAARDRQVTPYEAQYFWHCAQQQRPEDELPVDVTWELPKPFAVVAGIGFFAWALICFLAAGLPRFGNRRRRRGGDRRRSDGVVGRGSAVGRRVGDDAFGGTTDVEPAVVSAREFREDDSGYLAWIAAHPGGYVINIRRGYNPSDARLHLAI